MSAGTACRFEQGPCTYPTLRRHFKCQDGSCPEQSGRLCSHGAETKAPIRETPEPVSRRETPATKTKPAAPEPAREEEIMAPKKREVGTCTRCDRGPRPIGVTAGWDGLVCESCKSMVQKCTRTGKPIPPFTGKTLSKGEKAPGRSMKAPRAAAAPVQIAKPSPSIPKPPPAPPAVAAPRPAAAVPTAIETGHANGRAIVLRITCHEKSDIVRVLAATEGLSVHIGLDGLV